MASQVSTPASSPRSARSAQSVQSATSSIARFQVKTAEFLAAAIRLICQESGGDIEPEHLQVTVQGCMSHSDAQFQERATELGET
eukprot:4760121-Amphidinium_carterae.2